jgi:hypothetical protein
MVSGVQRAGCAMVLKHPISGMLDFGKAAFQTGGFQACWSSGMSCATNSGAAISQAGKRDVAGQDIE